MNSTTAPQISLVMINIAVVSAPDGQLWYRECSMPVGTTIEEALVETGFFLAFPEQSKDNVVVGVFGKRLSLSHCLEDHDRIEVYAPLRVDPKIARRRRAAHREKTRHIKKKMPVSDLTR